MTALVLGCPEAGRATPSPTPAGALAAGRNVARPRLVVVIVVDQMRDEMVDRFSPQWTGGLHRLATQGFRYTNATHRHAITYTAPGHASLTTGTDPRQHGIASNDWPTPKGKREYAAQDPNATLIGAEGEGLGPHALQRTGLGDWLIESAPSAKVWSLAIKDRAAVMMGARAAQGVIWWDKKAAKFISSSAYMQALPAWLLAFNDALGPKLEALATQGWVQGQPSRVSRDDEASFETQPSVFPHQVSEYKRGVGDFMRHTPTGDALSLELALKLIDAESLGEDGVPDLLWLGISGGDYIGHRYGPRSAEIEAYYNELDRELGNFFGALDAKFGEDYLLVLTSDHGVVEVPESGALSGTRFEPGEALKRVAKLLHEHPDCGVAKVELVEDRGIRVGLTPEPPADLRDRCESLAATNLLSEPWAMELFTSAQLEGRVAAPDSPFFEAYQRSHYPGRSPQLSLRWPEGWLLGRGYTAGTGHGSPYGYDQQVPLIFWNAKLKPTSLESPVALVDLAPTLSHVIGARAPEDLDGQALQEVLDAIAQRGWSRMSPEG